jgi:hypothetical protein
VVPEVVAGKVEEWDAETVEDIIAVRLVVPEVVAGKDEVWDTEMEEAVIA